MRRKEMHDNKQNQKERTDLILKVKIERQVLEQTTYSYNLNRWSIRHVTGMDIHLAPGTSLADWPPSHSLRAKNKRFDNARITFLLRFHFLICSFSTHL
jgi:hypothetical protein